jgi:hypothetical protein
MATGNRRVLGVRVECYAGYRSEQEPRRFHLGARTIEVLRILDRWLAPDHRYFKLRGSDGDTYLLRHDPTAEQWELVLYQSEPS